MKSKFILLSLLSSLLLPISASATVDYNIAKGLAPTSKDQSISVLKPFKGDFRILGSKMYSDDAQAKFSPIDYAVSWGLFAEPEIALVGFSMGGGEVVRYFSRYAGKGVTKAVLISSVTPYLLKTDDNPQGVPSEKSEEIAKQIKHVRRGDLVRLKGELVEIKDKDMVWTSSLTPTDTGDGACEVFRVSSIQWIERVKG